VRISYTVKKELDIRPEINLHGKTVEEPSLWWISFSMMPVAGLEQVTVIHGKGQAG